MSLLGPITNLIQRPTPGGVDFGKMLSADKLPSAPELGGAELRGLQPTVAPTTATPSSFGAILDHVVGEVNSKLQAGSAEQAKVLSGESTNLHQAMISMQEGNVAFSLMVEVRNKLVEGYQELMRMQV